MLTRIVAQGLTDILSATALGAGQLSAVRRGLRSPLDVRMAFALGGAALFFLFRGAAEIFAQPGLELVAELVVCPLPIAALLLAEGLQRRHAPWALKAAIVLGAAGLEVGLVAVGGRQPMSSWGLGGYVIASFAALTVLLLLRDRASLSHQENASIDAMMLAGAALTLLCLTDFLPAAPLGMSGAGAALVAYLANANPSSPRAVRNTISDILVIVVFAGLFAAGLGKALAVGSSAEIVRLGVVTLAFAVASSAVRGALRERAGQDEALALRRALAGAETTDLQAFLESLVGQSLLRGMRMAEAGALDDYDAEALGETLAARPIWSRRALADPDTPSPIRGRDELADLMERNDASHAAVISRAPLRIALFTLPQIGPADDAETDLALFRKLAEIAAGAPA